MYRQLYIQIIVFIVNEQHSFSIQLSLLITKTGEENVQISSGDIAWPVSLIETSKVPAANCYYTATLAGASGKRAEKL